MSHKPLKIGLFGFGTVGQGLYTLLEKTTYPHASIAQIVIKDASKPRPIASELFSTDPNTILERDDIDLVIEVTSDAAAAYDIAQQTLFRGRSLITANKKMVARHLPELIAWQQATGQTILYEAAVCGAIPILQTLESYFGHEKIERLDGVFNGTTNFMLSAMEDGLAYDEALSLAQEKGLAEADPTSDVDGFDAQYKLAIAGAHAFGRLSHPDDIYRLGIRHIQRADVAYATRKGFRIRLLAIGEPNATFRVAPVFVEKSSTAYGLKGEDNYVHVGAPFAGAQIYQGKGAGAFPTGTAVLQDIERYRQGFRYAYARLQKGDAPQSGLESIPVYIGARVIDQIKSLPLKAPQLVQESNGHVGVVAWTSWDKLPALSSVFVALLTPDQARHLLGNNAGVLAA